MTKYEKRVKAIAREIQRAHGIVFRQALEIAKETDLQYQLHLTLSKGRA